MSPGNAQPDSAAQVTLLYGRSELLNQRAAQPIINGRLSPDERTDGLSVLVASDFDPQQFAAQLSSRSLLVSERVVMIKRVDDLKAPDQRLLAASLGRLPQSTTVILTAAETDKGRKPAVRKDLADAVKQAGEIALVPCPEKEAVAAWISKEAGEHGKRITGPATELLRELTEDNVDMLVSEVAKVATYAGDRPQIDEADVQAVGSGSQQGNVWKLVDAIGNRRADQALHHLSVMLPPGSASGAAPPLLGMINRQLRLIWQARVAAREGYRLDRSGKLPADLAAKFPSQHHVVKTIGGRTWMARELTRQAAKFKDAQLAQALARVQQTDLALKGRGGVQIEERAALEALVVELCQL